MGKVVAKRTHQLARRFREVMLDGTWIAGTNFKAQLSEIHWTQAIQKIESLNTVAALTFHINYYIEGVLKVLKGGPLDISDKYSFDMPPIALESQWLKMVETLIYNASQLADHLEQMPDEQLDEVFADQKYGTYQRNIDGVIEHSYYHLAQVVLIRKLISEKNSK
jgi:hypothetical protein